MAKMNNSRPKSPAASIYRHGRLATTSEIYQELKGKAIKNGWKTPESEPNKGEQQSWISYWVDMHLHDELVRDGDKDSGRPVIPHRTGR